MQIIVNSKSHELQNGEFVNDLLVELGLENKRVIVEQNGAIVTRTNYTSEKISNGDRFEIVHFVGGG